MKTKTLAPMLALALVLATGPARAATLSFEGSFEWVRAGGQPIVIPGTGLATVKGSVGGPNITALAIPGRAFLGTGSAVIYNRAPISGILLAGGTAYTIYHVISGALMSQSANIYYPTGSVSNAAGSFSGAPLKGPMPINGVAIVCLFAPCSGNVAANLVVPLTPVGQGGTATFIGLLNVSLIGAPWTTGTVQLTESVCVASYEGCTSWVEVTHTQMGFQHGPASETSTAALPSGVISLVTPVVFSTDVSQRDLSVIPFFGTLTLHFTPEPSTLLLQGVAVAVLCVIGRRKARHAITRE